MKTIGLIGGMNWESSNLYYRIINERAEGIILGGAPRSGSSSRRVIAVCACSTRRGFMPKPPLITLFSTAEKAAE